MKGMRATRGIGLVSLALAVMQSVDSLRAVRGSPGPKSMLSHQGSVVRRYLKRGNAYRRPHQGKRELARRVRQIAAGMDCGQNNTWTDTPARAAHRVSPKSTRAARRREAA